MDLIDRKELIRQIRLQANRSSLGETAYREPSFGEVAGLIMDAPTVYAKPVRHGKWIFNKEKRTWECSECHYKTGSALIESKTNYCCECGAEMDGD